MSDASQDLPPEQPDPGHPAPVEAFGLLSGRFLVELLSEARTLAQRMEKTE